MSYFYLKRASYFLASLLTAPSLISLTIHASYASEVCNTTEECLALQVKIVARLKVLQLEKIPQLMEVAKKPDGSLLLMNHLQAIEHCQKQGEGWRLPTPRELALISQSMEARGIRETEFPGVPSDDKEVQLEISIYRRSGYEVIYALKGTNTQVVDFYYSDKLFTPKGDFEKYYYYSSTEEPDLRGFAYILHGFDGTFGNWNRKYENPILATQCVRSRQ